MRILTSFLIFLFGIFCTVVFTASLAHVLKLNDKIATPIALVLFVFVVLLTARHMFGESQRTENHYTFKGEDTFKGKECDYCYFPEGNPPIGQRCSLCGKFNSLKDLGI